MARLASQAKSGYYPTPPEVVAHVKRGLALAEEGPFGSWILAAAAGRALAQLAEGLPVETFGVELAQERYEEAKTRLRNIILADAITETNLTRNAFSLLWLNPPYDFEADGGPDWRKPSWNATCPIWFRAGYWCTSSRPGPCSTWSGTWPNWAIYQVLCLSATALRPVQAGGHHRGEEAGAA